MDLKKGITPAPTSPFNWRKKVTTYAFALKKNFCQGWAFCSSTLWVASSWAIVFLLPLAFGYAISDVDPSVNPQGFE